MFVNKLERINLKNTLKLTSASRSIKIYKGNYIRLAYFSNGWFLQHFYGICLKTTKLSNFQNKVLLYNSKQRMHYYANINFNYFKSIIRIS